MSLEKKIKRVMKCILLFLVVICVMQLVRGRFLVPSMIQRVEFRGYDSCDSPASKEVELNRFEIWTLAACYNLSSFAGSVNAEGCPSDYGFKIYWMDGAKISVREANAPRVEVSRPFSSKFWIKSSILDWYAQKLLEKYDLTDS